MLVGDSGYPVECQGVDSDTTVIKLKKKIDLCHIQAFTFKELPNSYVTNLLFCFFFFILGKKEGTERGTTWEEGVFDISLNFLANPKSHSCQETNLNFNVI